MITLFRLWQVPFKAWSQSRNLTNNIIDNVYGIGNIDVTITVGIGRILEEGGIRLTHYVIDNTHGIGNIHIAIGIDVAWGHFYRQHAIHVGNLLVLGFGIRHHHVVVACLG